MTSTTPATTPATREDVMTPLRAYIRGHATGDPTHFRAAFLPTAHVKGIRNGSFVSWRLDDYCALFHGRPAADEAESLRDLLAAGAQRRAAPQVDDHRARHFAVLL